MPWTVSTPSKVALGRDPEAKGLGPEHLLAAHVVVLHDLLGEAHDAGAVRLGAEGLALDRLVGDEVRPGLLAGKQRVQAGDDRDALTDGPALPVGERRVLVVGADVLVVLADQDDTV